MDTEAARAEYVTGRVTYQQIADKHGVSKSYIEKVAKREGWKRQRDAFRQKVADKAIETKRQWGTRQLVKMMDTAEQLIAEVGKVTTDPEQFYLYRTETGEIRARVADTRRMRETARTLSELIRVARDLSEIEDGTERRKLEIEKRKLRIMERREGAEEGSSGGVIMMPAVMPEQEDGEEVSQ